jgi:hypothetical protein
MNEADLYALYLERALKEVEELIRAKILLLAKLDMAEKIIAELNMTITNQAESFNATINTQADELAAFRKKKTKEDLAVKS